MPRAAAPTPLLPIPDGLLGAPDAEYPALARRFREELAPRGLLEGLQVDLALMALALLRRALAALALADDDPAETRARRAQAQAHKMLTQALREFGRLRKARPAEAPDAVAAAPTRVEPRPAPRPPDPRPARPAPPTPPSPVDRRLPLPLPPFDDLLGLGLDLAIAPTSSVLNLTVGRT